MGATPPFIFSLIYIFSLLPLFALRSGAIKDCPALVPLSFIFTIDFWSLIYYRRSFLEQGRISPSEREGKANIPQCATVAWLSNTACKLNTCPKLMTVSPIQITAT